MDNPDALLKYAVEQAIQLINSDKLQPEAAVTKIARELELNPNFIKRASEAINVALTYNHMKTAADKAADFPIVDAQNVVRSIFGEKEKTAAEYAAEQFSTHQVGGVTPKIDRYLNDPRYKAAYEAILNTVAPSHYPMSERGVYEKSANYLRDLRKIEDKALSDKCAAEYDSNQAFCDILAALSKGAEYRTSFAEFERQVLAKHAEAAKEYLDLIHRCMKTGEARGEHDPNVKVIEQCKEAALFDRFLAKVAEYHQSVEIAKVASENYKFEKDYVTEIFHGANLDKEADAVTELTAIDKLTRQKAKQRKQEAVIDPVLKRANEKLAAVSDREEQIKEAFNFVDSAMERFRDEGKPSSQLTSNSPEDNRQRKFVLQELAVTDPILKSVDPQKLVDSYSQMLAIAPELAKEKELVRSTLRSMTASQALGPFEGQQLMQANNEMLKQRAMVQGRQPAPGGGKA